MDSILSIIFWILVVLAIIAAIYISNRNKKILMRLVEDLYKVENFTPTYRFPYAKGLEPDYSCFGFDFDRYLIAGNALNFGEFDVKSMKDIVDIGLKEESFHFSLEIKYSDNTSQYGYVNRGRVKEIREVINRIRALKI